MEEPGGPTPLDSYVPLPSLHLVSKWRQSLGPDDRCLEEVVTMVVAGREAARVVSGFVEEFDIGEVMAPDDSYDPDITGKLERIGYALVRTDDLSQQALDLGRFLTDEPTEADLRRPWEPQDVNLFPVSSIESIRDSARATMTSSEEVTPNDLLWLDPADKIRLFDAAWRLSIQHTSGAIHLKAAAIADEFRVLARFPEFRDLVRNSMGTLENQANLMARADSTGNVAHYDAHALAMSSGVLELGRRLATNMDTAKEAFKEPIAQQALDNLEAICFAENQFLPESTPELQQARVDTFHQKEQALKDAMMTAYEPLTEQFDTLERGYRQLRNTQGIPSEREVKRLRRNPNFSDVASQLRRSPGFNPKRAASVAFFTGWHMAGLIRDNGAEKARRLLQEALAEEDYFRWGAEEVKGRLSAIGIRADSPTFRDMTLREVADLAVERWGIVEPILRRNAAPSSALIREGILDQMGDVISMRPIRETAASRRYLQEDLSPEEIRRRQLLRYEARLLYEGSEGIPGLFARRRVGSADRSFDPKDLTQVYRRQFKLSPERLAVVRALVEAFPGKYYSEKELDLGRARLARFVIVVGLGEHDELVPESAAAPDRLWIVGEPPEADRSTLVHRGANWRSVLHLPVLEMPEHGTRRLIHPTHSDKFGTMGNIVETLIADGMPERVAMRALDRLRQNEEAGAAERA
jgi:hypothetical protein